MLTRKLLSGLSDQRLEMFDIRVSDYVGLGSKPETEHPNAGTFVYYLRRYARKCGNRKSDLRQPRFRRCLPTCLFAARILGLSALRSFLPYVDLTTLCWHMQMQVLGQLLWQVPASAQSVAF